MQDADGRFLFIQKHYEGKTRFANDIPAGGSRQTGAQNLRHTAEREVFGEEAIFIDREGKIVIPTREEDDMAFIYAAIAENYGTAQNTGLLQLPPDIHNIFGQIASHRFNPDVFNTTLLSPNPLLPEVDLTIQNKDSDDFHDRVHVAVHREGLDAVYQVKLDCSFTGLRAVVDTESLDHKHAGTAAYTPLQRDHLAMNKDEIARLQAGETISVLVMTPEGTREEYINLTTHPWCSLAAGVTTSILEYSPKILV